MPSGCPFGFQDVMKYWIGWRKTFPYHDPNRMEMLRNRGILDSLSELLVGFVAAAAYAAETAVKTLDSAPVFHFNYSVVDVETNSTRTVEFQAPIYVVTCVGWSFEVDLEPPPHPKRSVAEVVWVFFLVAVHRKLPRDYERVEICY